MTILILAAGYATRLYPLTLDTPKPLLKVAGKAILEHIFEKIEELEDVRKCYIVTNQKFFASFSAWAKRFRAGRPGAQIEVISDESTTNENRLGAIRDIEFVVNKKGIEDDLLIIGGDNLFEFSLKEFTGFSKGRRPDSSLALFDIRDMSKASLYGVAGLDAAGKVVNFKEKPKQPESTLIATCVYYFPKDRLNDLSEYISLGAARDAPGNYIRWLSEKGRAYGFVFKEAWYDIGDIKSLQEADKAYKTKNKN
ncbi:MAG: nucleotidyltransferase family protein [Candidatus Omnitrophica bacterium]|nr:nucleotidyltransferase family protein [Candidatus Omnitrophota bacterium]